MAIPKNKRRDLIVADKLYHWCTTNKVKTIFDEEAQNAMNQAMTAIQSNPELKHKRVGIMLSSGMTTHYHETSLYIESAEKPQLTIKAVFDSRAIYPLAYRMKHMDYLSITPDLVRKTIEYALAQASPKQLKIDIPNAATLFEADLVAALQKLGHWVPSDKINPVVDTNETDTFFQ